MLLSQRVWRKGLPSIAGAALFLASGVMAQPPHQQTPSAKSAASGGSQEQLVEAGQACLLKLAPIATGRAVKVGKAKAKAPTSSPITTCASSPMRS